MTPFTLATWSDSLQRHRALLREDRVEDLTYSLLHAEVGRLFFDEATCATVHPKPAWPAVLTGVLCFFIFFGIALSMHSEPAFAATWGGIGLLLTLVALMAAVFPNHQLTIRTADQTMTITLGRRKARREEVLRRLTEAVRAWQEKGA